MTRRSAWPNYALVCGLLRDELEFRITLAQLVEARAEGLIDGIVLSTWIGEIDAIAGLREELEALGVVTVEAWPPKFNLVGNAWAQHKTTLLGLRAIPDDAAVWRLRTDRTAHLFKAFRGCLEAGPTPCRQAGPQPPVFERRVAAMAVVATVPFYAADFAFYGLKRDLLRMTQFEGVYDSLFSGFGAENRLWTHPFLTAFPRLGELYERVNILGLSSHILRAAREGRAIPDYLLYFLAFYWLQLYDNIQLIEERASLPLKLTLRAALGGESCGALRFGTVASRFTVNIAVFNSQQALDDLVEGNFDDDSELGRRYRRILAELKAKGPDALPPWTEAETALFTAWSEAVPEAELLQNQPRVSRPAGAAAPVLSGDLLAGAHLRQMLLRDGKARDVDDETLALVAERLALTRRGVDTGQVYRMIATEILRTACDDRSRKLLGGAFLLRSAERGNVESAAQYGWLVYSGRLEVDSRDPATKWTRTAAVKENPLGQYTCALMCRNGWFGEEQREAADDWHRKALRNGFSPEMLQFS